MQSKYFCLFIKLLIGKLEEVNPPFIKRRGGGVEVCNKSFFAQVNNNLYKMKLKLLFQQTMCNCSYVELVKSYYTRKRT